MRIINNDDARLKIISQASETQSVRSEMTIEGTGLKLPIKGVNLELCIELNKRYLVFTTDDCPFEESLNIYLLSNENRILDSATVFWPYGTGSFELLRLIEPDGVQFKFFGNKVWQVTVFQKKRFYVPYISEPSGIWRPIKFRRFF